MAQLFGLVRVPHIDTNVFYHLCVVTCLVLKTAILTYSLPLCVLVSSDREAAKHQRLARSLDATLEVRARYNRLLHSLSFLTLRQQLT